MAGCYEDAKSGVAHIKKDHHFIIEVSEVLSEIELNILALL